MCFVLFIVCLYICVCECLLQNANHKTKHKDNNISKQHLCVRGPLWECCSIRSGASGLPYYCAPLVCISAVIGLLAVWRHNKPKTKNLYCALRIIESHQKPRIPGPRETLSLGAQWRLLVRWFHPLGQKSLEMAHEPRGVCFKP